MRRSFLLIIAILLTVFSYCTQEPGAGGLNSSEEQVLLHSGKPKLDASAVSGQTKTHWDGSDVLWSAHDRISIFAERNNQWVDAYGAQSDETWAEFSISPTVLSKDCQKADFAVPPSMLSDHTGNWVFHGVYPSDCLIDKRMSDATGFRFRLGYRQIPTRRNATDTFDPGCDVMVGHTATISGPEGGKSYPMEWKRLVAHLALTIEDIPILDGNEVVTSISLTSEDGEALAGDFRYDLASGTYDVISPTSTVSMVAEGNNLAITERRIGNLCVCLIPQKLTTLKLEIRTNRARYFKQFSDIDCTLSANRRTALHLDMAGALVDKSSRVEDDPDNTLKVSCSYDISIPEHIIAQRKISDMGTFYLYTPEVNATAAVDLHLEVFPIYVFGDGNVSGDYYCVEGYLMSRNGIIYAERSNQGVKICGWYPSQYCLDFQLLGPDGKELEDGAAEFFVRPEPSTTISTWVYSKGSTFTLEPRLTFGSVRKDGLSGVLSWINILLGSIAFGYKYETSSTQRLPDQSVLMSTKLATSAVHYEVNSNNDTGGYTTKDIPAVFTSDQRIDFSWVWHLKSGKYCARDYDFGNMKMKATVRPIYKSAYKGVIRNNQGRAVFEGWAFYDHEDLQAEFDLPAMNRIPAGDIELKVATTENVYLTGLEVYRSGEYTVADHPYYSDKKGYPRNQVIKMQLRSGTYDLLYNLQNGSTGEILYKMIYPNVEVKAGSVLKLASYDGTVRED